MKPEYDFSNGQRGKFFKKNAVLRFDRVTLDPQVMNGKPCIRGMRVTVDVIVGLVAAGHSNAEILVAYPYLEEEDIRQALVYAAA